MQHPRGQAALRSVARLSQHCEGLAAACTEPALPPEPRAAALRMHIIQIITPIMHKRVLACLAVAEDSAAVPLQGLHSGIARARLHARAGHARR